MQHEINSTTSTASHLHSPRRIHNFTFTNHYQHNITTTVLSFSCFSSSLTSWPKLRSIIIQALTGLSHLFTSFFHFSFCTWEGQRSRGNKMLTHGPGRASPGVRGHQSHGVLIVRSATCSLNPTIVVYS